MAEAVEAPRAEARAGPSAAAEALELEADERRLEEQRKRSRDPPIVYKDIDVSAHSVAYILQRSNETGQFSSCILTCH